jgi:serine/threonine protein kinase
MEIELLPTFEESYAIEGVIGSGFWATVYLATRDGKKYAAKIPHHDSDTDIESLEGRYKTVIDTSVDIVLDQARTIAKLQDESRYFPKYFGLYKTYRRIYRTSRWIPVLVMEMIEGPSLEQIMDTSEELLDGEASVNILRDVIAGVRALHNRGLVHGDIKEDNIIVNGDEAVIIDIAGVVEDLTEYNLAEELGTITEYEEELLERNTMLELNMLKDIYGIGQVMLNLSSYVEGNTASLLSDVGTQATSEDIFERPSLEDMLNMLA